MDVTSSIRVGGTTYMRTAWQWQLFRSCERLANIDLRTQKLNLLHILNDLTIFRFI
jgi:hypothetical protein